MLPGRHSRQSRSLRHDEGRAHGIVSASDDKFCARFKNYRIPNRSTKMVAQSCVHIILVVNLLFPFDVHGSAIFIRLSHHISHQLSIKHHRNFIVNRLRSILQPGKSVPH